MTGTFTPNTPSENLKIGSCFFGHKWTKWELIDQKIGKVIDGVPYEGFKTIQVRSCIRCGKTQSKGVD